MPRAILELIGDADSLLKSFAKSSDAADKFGKDLKQLSVTAEQTARAQVQAAVRRDARLRQEIAVYRQVAQAAQKGSREQVAAANLATRSEERLARSLAITSREAKEHARSVEHAERQLGKFSRGALAGSGVAKGLGRSLAFASGGFLATASVTELLRRSIEQGSEAAATQKQLAAQFRESGIRLEEYRDQINQTISAVSRLSGFEDDELTRAFTVAFRATKNVSQALEITRTAADAARGSHRSLSSVTLGLTRAWGGAATSLRRLGILIPTTAKGMDAIRFVSERFAGQAEAGTTAQERFRAALVNTEQTIGLALLPTFNRLLNNLTEWLSKEENQKRLARDLNTTLAVTGKIVHGLAGAFHILAVGLRPIVRGFASLIELGRQIHDVFMRANDAIRNAANFLGGPFGIHFGNDNIAPSNQPGQSTADRRAGRAPGGAGTFAPIVAGSAPGQQGFKARFATLQLRLAQAELTKTQADDRKILQLEAALIRERIKTLGTSRKTLDERTQLTQQLVGIEGQLASIDEQGATARRTAAQRQLAAQEKRLAAEKSAAENELAGMKERERTLRSKIKQIQDSFRSAVETARQGIGDLFGGPVLNFSDEQRKAALGIPNTAADPRALAADLKAQVQQAKAFQRNLRILQKRGASKQLIGELQAAGVADSAQAAALAGAPKAVLKEFFKEFAAREKIAQNIARAEMRIQLATLHADRLRLTGVRERETKIQVFIDGVEQKQAKVKVKQSAAQRRGPVPGRS